MRYQVFQKIKIIVMIEVILLINICEANYNEHRLHEILNRHNYDTWSSCKQDNNCKYIIGPCQVPVAINKRYEKEVFKLFHYLTLEEKHCVDLVGSKLPTKVACKNKRCVNIREIVKNK